MRIATWNVNSLKARLEKVEWWLDRAQPDVLLLQETKLTDLEVPLLPFQARGYEVVHHGEGRWNGVAIAARNGLAISDVVTNFGDGPVRDSGPGGAGGWVAAPRLGRNRLAPWHAAGRRPLPSLRRRLGSAGVG